jgi:hypothetical protein
VRHTLPQHFSSAGRREELQPGDVQVIDELLALAVHPQNTEA